MIISYYKSSAVKKTQHTFFCIGHDIGSKFSVIVFHLLSGLPFADVISWRPVIQSSTSSVIFWPHVLMTSILISWVFMCFQFWFVLSSIFIFLISGLFPTPTSLLHFVHLLTYSSLMSSFTLIGHCCKHSLVRDLELLLFDRSLFFFFYRMPSIPYCWVFFLFFSFIFRFHGVLHSFNPWSSLIHHHLRGLHLRC